jgi:hypothetical protein
VRQPNKYIFGYRTREVRTRRLQHLVLDLTALHNVKRPSTQSAALMNTTIQLAYFESAPSPFRVGTWRCSTALTRFASESEYISASAEDSLARSGQRLLLPVKAL